jgi:phosphatidylinositol glycan class B
MTVKPPNRAQLLGILLLALAIRLWVLATDTYIAHPDETFQYLEPAHRLAFGSGVVTWEFIDGIRSWLLPIAIAGVMRLISAFDTDPRTYVFVLRLLCVIASLIVPYAGFRIAERLAGSGAGLAAGILCALSPQALYFSSVIMTEPLATDLALLAVAIGGDARARPRKLLLAGALFGLAAALRYQYAPILAAAALWQFGRNRRSLMLVSAAGLAVVALALGVLDAATWTVPFQSVWLNFLRNGPQGISQAMGTESWSYYLKYFAAGWGAVAPAVLLCLALGARRAPALAIFVFGTVGLHMLTPHKELRFILLATVTLPVLLGIGLHDGIARLPRRWSGLSTRVGLAVFLAVAIAWGTLSRATPPDAWHRDRSLLQATAAARAIPEVCGLAIRTAWVYRTGGYSYWHRNEPLYFGTWYPAQVLPDSDIRLPLESVLPGRSVRQFPDADLVVHTDAFNALIGLRSDALPGFTEQACFGSGRPDDRTFCVFTRPGGCG